MAGSEFRDIDASLTVSEAEEQARRLALLEEMLAPKPKIDTSNWDMVLRVVRADTGERVEVARVPLAKWGPEDGFELVAVPPGD